MRRAQILKRALPPLVAVLAVAIHSSPALAVQHHPKGIFAPFADCPLNNPAVRLCLVAKLSGGELVLGAKTVPISKALVLRAGLIPAGGSNFNEYVLASAEDGATLSKVALPIPGGITGTRSITGATEATAVSELASLSGATLNFTNFIEEKEIALKLPLRIKLENRELGGNCYVGSSSHPLTLEFTDGTTDPLPPNRPIKGSFGTPASIVEDGNEMLVQHGGWFVDNTFAAPAANGCAGIVYPSLIDSYVGLPSASGRNTAVVGESIELAESNLVKASE